VADVAGQLVAAWTEGGVVGGNPERVEEIKGRFTYRMHGLGEFMKGLLQRFTQWFNGRHKRAGTRAGAENFKLQTPNPKEELCGGWDE